MAVSELVHPGSKVEIRFVQQMEKEQKSGNDVKGYKSSVLDVKQNGNIEIAMPTEGGGLVLLPLGVRLEFFFYGSGNLYRGIGQIRERYKKDNMHMLEVEMKTRLEKFQRREYYRYACVLDFSYYGLTKEQAAMDSADDMLKSLQKESAVPAAQSGTAVELSGGGMKFCSESALEEGKDILLSLHLSNGRMDKQYDMPAAVAGCSPMEESESGQYEIRVRFMMKDNKIREEIIRYIFEEERKIRQRENHS